MRRTLPVSPIANLRPFLETGKLVAFNCGPDKTLYLAVALNPTDYEEQSKHAMFPKTVPAAPQNYRIIALSGETPTLDIEIKIEPFNIHDIQPLADELLLVCNRSHFRSSTDFEKNGRVYTRDGKFVREILLGDGIAATQTTTKGIIWTSFFDEGVFGNSIAASGLIARNRDGTKIFEFEPSAGLDRIDDCYALNVESEDDTWCYYYTEFPLVRLRRMRIDSIWNMPCHCSRAFAISGDYALFTGPYKDYEPYQLFRLESNQRVELVANFEVIDERGERIIPNRVVGRGDAIHIISNDRLYRISIQEMLAS